MYCEHYEIMHNIYSDSNVTNIAKTLLLNSD